MGRKFETMTVFQLSDLQEIEWTASISKQNFNIPKWMLPHFDRICDDDRNQGVVFAPEKNRIWGRKIADIHEAVRIGLIGFSDQMIRLVTELVPETALSTDNVCIIGETGTGKEKIAQLIHNKRRKGERFLKINCAALPDSLAESLLFGYKKGAFTGANRDKKGFFEEAKGGTIFFDELSKMPLHQQAMLLRVLEEKQFLRIGDSKETEADFYAIFALNEDPINLIGNEEGNPKLLNDLYFRISTHEIRVPPLNERLNSDNFPGDRVSDIDILLTYFILGFLKERGKTAIVLPDDWIEYIKSRKYSGNVRELKTRITRLLNRIVFSNSRNVEDILNVQFPQAPKSTLYRMFREGIFYQGEDIKKSLTGELFESHVLNFIDIKEFFGLPAYNAYNGNSTLQESIPPDIIPYTQIENLNDLKHYHIQRIYKKHNDAVGNAAKALGIKANTVRTWLKKDGLNN